MSRVKTIKNVVINLIFHVSVIFNTNQWETTLCKLYCELKQTATITAEKMKFSVKDFFSKCDQIRRKLRIWSHLLEKSFMENFIFCAVTICVIPAPQVHFNTLPILILHYLVGWLNQYNKCF